MPTLRMPACQQVMCTSSPTRPGNSTMGWMRCALAAVFPHGREFACISVCLVLHRSVMLGCRVVVQLSLPTELDHHRD